jgi:hypothetical protein
MNTEVFEIIQEGFRLQHKALEAIVEEMRADTPSYLVEAERMNTDKRMDDLREWAEGSPDE